MNQREKDLYDYWERFLEHLASEGFPVAQPTEKQKREHWLGFPLGTAGCSLVTVASAQKEQIWAELLLEGPLCKQRFEALSRDKVAIQQALGSNTRWDDGRGRQRAKIMLAPHHASPSDYRSWTEQHRLLAHDLDRLDRALRRRIEALPL